MDILKKQERADDYTIKLTKIEYAINGYNYEVAIIDRFGEIKWIDHRRTRREADDSFRKAKRFLKGSGTVGMES